MTETWNQQTRDALVDYRMQRADETLQEAHLLADAEHYIAAVNRLYYACYYAVSAALTKNHIAAATRAGVKTMLGLHFIATGQLPRECGKTFSRLFEMRHSGDYDDFAYWDRDTVELFIPKATELVEAVRALVRKG